MKVRPSKFNEQLNQLRSTRPANTYEPLTLPSKPTQVSPISEAIDSLNVAREELNKTLCELESRLKSVLSSPPPSDVGTQPATPAEGTELGQKIRTASDSIADAARFVNSLLCRLEL